MEDREGGARETALTSLAPPGLAFTHIEFVQHVMLVYRVPRKGANMGYVPLFDTLITGTLHGKWPDIGLWPVILSMADKNGNVDVTPQYIAGVTGLNIEHVTACIDRFCAPDPDSRSQVDDGRRLEPLDPNRKWGWHVINHATYREKARLLSRDAARTASGADAERKRRERSQSTLSPPTSPEVSPSDSDANSDKDSKTSDTGAHAPKPKRVLRVRAQIGGFALDERMTSYALDRLPDMDTEATFRDFRDYHLAKGDVAADWGASWRTWINNCCKGFEYVRRNGPMAEANTPKLTPAEWRAKKAREAQENGARPLLE